MNKSIHRAGGLALSALLLAAGAAWAGDEPEQPKAPGIESPGYVWNEMRGEKLLALGAKGDAERGEIAFETCQGCHGFDALGDPDGTYPRLAGQHGSVLIKQLTDVRLGVRDNRKMFPFADQHVIAVQDIADIALYLQNLQAEVKQGQGSGADLELGKKLYEKDCMECHGARGEGDAQEFYPRLEGQHYRYLLRQFNDIRSGKRRNANPDMVKAAKPYTEQDIKAMIDYVSRLTPAAN